MPVYEGTFDNCCKKFQYTYIRSNIWRSGGKDERREGEWRGEEGKMGKVEDRRREVEGRGEGGEGRREEEGRREGRGEEKRRRGGEGRKRRGGEKEGRRVKILNMVMKRHCYGMLQNVARL